MPKKYTGIKSTVKKPKSSASSSATERNRRQKLAAAGAANKGKYTGLKSSVSAKKPAKSKPKKMPVRVVPMKRAQHLVDQLPETDLTRKGRTLQELLMTTPKLMIEGSADVVLSGKKKQKTKTGKPAYSAIAVTKDPYKPSATERKHECMIIGLDADKKIYQRGQKVVCSCSCENYVFMWEYANAKHGASQLIYGNGDRPGFTNPSEVPGLCKHLVALGRTIRQKGY